MIKQSHSCTYSSSKKRLAFDYLQQNRHGHCIILNSGRYDPNGYSWGGFTIGLLADFEARLSIFYSDLKEGKTEVKEIPSDKVVYTYGDVRYTMLLFF